MKILVLGGYGVFGGRLVRCLSDCADLHLVIAGRSGGAARKFCEEFEGAPELTALKLSREQAAAALARLKPDLVVDATGPFQTYGDDPYALPRAAIAAGVSYLDFSDGAAFTDGIAELDAAARAAGVFVLSGVSSFPVLTAAVVRALAGRDRVIRVTGGIAPSPHAGIGMNVMRAVTGYAGEAVTLMRNGTATQVPGLTESLRFTIAPPGRLPLRSTRFSLVDVPELRVLPRRLPDLQDIWMGAGPTPEPLHLALNGLAWLRARRLLPNLSRGSALFHRVLDMTRRGAHRGGMFVEVETDRGVRIWHLLAEGDAGPLIPAMAIEILIRKLLAGSPPAPGARPAVDALDLADYEAAFARHDIHSGIRTPVPPGAPLYRRILGDSYDELPAPVAALHDLHKPVTWVGTARVERSRSVLARLAGALLRLPAAGQAVPLSVSFTPLPGGAERWDRRFDGRLLRSVQQPGRGRNSFLIDESFGPVTVSLACVRDGDKLRIIPRRWRIFGIPLPAALLPGGDSHETGADGRFNFHVEFTTPLTGLIARYSGWLEPA